MGAVILAEAAAMVFFDEEAVRPAPWVILADAAFLGVFLVPMLYALVIRPSRAQVAGLEEEVARRAAAEQALEAKNTLNRLLVDSLPHPAWLIDRDRKVLLQNRKGGELRPEGGDHCWQGFSSPPGSAAGSGACTFCRADEALEKNETQTATIELAGRTWDAFWVPVD
ncbi:MAG: hypothetical protein HGA98_05505, partial [Deltaproteobacteria bacterium]|nr:hypothetical protein [Deltaproteobacteria bacterium]